MEYKPTIGLEIHTELRTKTKMFCSCKNDTDEKRSNINICPICLGHPGTLPTINKEAILQVLKVGTALGSTLADETEFDRKNYFYPDIPKGYQISQYKYPLVSGGELLGFKLNRIHLEEDTAKSSHDTGDCSLIDFNRAGVPLMELVTEPVFHKAEDVVLFGKELQILLQTIGVSFANMEKGELRLEANISVSNNEKLGTKVEIKNLNSFRSAEKAILYEIDRQIDLLKNSEIVKQETRGWDDIKNITFSQRSKEDSHDYRYFPDPDLPKIKLSLIDGFNKDAIKSKLNETPEEKRSRFKDKYSIKDSDIDFYIHNTNLSDFFEKSAALIDFEGFQILSNYIVSDLASSGLSHNLNEISFSSLIRMILSGEVSSRGAKDILNILILGGGDPRIIAQEMALFQKSDESELTTIVNDILSKNKDIVIDYKNGKTSVIQFLVGQGMKATKGSANPQLLKNIIEKVLNN